MSQPKLGEAFPDFVLIDTNKQNVTIANIRGKQSVLAFFPGAFTGTCTREMCTFRDSLHKLNDLGARVVAISVNDPWSNKAFAEKNNLQFPVLSDYNRELVRKLGIYHDDFMGFKGYTVAKRSVFILDAGGLVRWKWVSEDPSKEPPYGEVNDILAKTE